MENAVFRQLDELSKSKEEALIEMADEYEEKLNLKDAIILEVSFVLKVSSTDRKLSSNKLYCDRWLKSRLHYYYIF